MHRKSLWGAVVPLTMALVEDADPADPDLETDKFPNLKMSCGHIYSSGSLVGLIKSATASGQKDIKCSYCPNLIDFEACNKFLPLTLKERNDIETAINKNAFLFFDGGIECPYCRTYISKDTENPDDVRVNCARCVSVLGRKQPDFCFKCRNPWRGEGNKTCGN